MDSQQLGAKREARTRVITVARRHREGTGLLIASPPEPACQIWLHDAKHGWPNQVKIQLIAFDTMITNEELQEETA